MPIRRASALAATFAACTCLCALDLTSCDGYYMVRTSHLDTAPWADASPLLAVVLMSAPCLGYCCRIRLGRSRRGGVDVRLHRGLFAHGHVISCVLPSPPVPSTPALVIVAESTCPSLVSIPLKRPRVPIQSHSQAFALPCPHSTTSAPALSPPADSAFSP